MIFLAQTAQQDQTVITWASDLAPSKFFAGVIVGVLVIWHWWHVRPCNTCGEYRQQCRCKARDY